MIRMPWRLPSRRPGSPDLSGYRYELKFVIDPLTLPMVMSWIRVHPAAFRRAFPPRLVNSLYFDNGEWSSLEDNLAGVAERSKLRLRWYGDNLCSVNGSLELKVKRGELGRKIAVCMDHRLDLRDRRWFDVLRELRSRPLGELAPVVRRQVFPTFIGTYRREYFATGDRSVRLTIDSGIRLYDQTRSATPNLDRPAPAEPVAVVELKCAATDAAELRSVASRLPLQRVAYSKYAQGVLTTLARMEPAAGALGRRSTVDAAADRTLPLRRAA